MYILLLESWIKLILRIIFILLLLSERREVCWNKLINSLNQLSLPNGRFFMEKLIENAHIISVKPIEPPTKLKADIPNDSNDLIAKTRQEIRDILHGRDTNRLLVVVGPCSIHDPEAAIEYAQRLNSLRSRLENEMVIVMRTYFEKPRTTVGWTGMVQNPDLDGSSNASTGLLISRQLLSDVNRSGLPCATEFLDPITPQYLADLVSWAAIGARTVESQIHRQLASGLSMPVGFKNSTEGNIIVAVDAMVAAANTHTFLGMDANGQAAIVETTGNPDAHIVLRGGRQGTNYDQASMDYTVSLIKDRNLLTETCRPVMIDCSHGNSAKDYRRQSHVIENVLAQVQPGRHHILGFMLESNLREGRQDWVKGKQLEYGVSITDACIGWEETEHLLLDCALMIQPKRFVLD